MPKVSVIIPIYGTTPYLKEALQALARQTCTDFEIIEAHPPSGSEDAGTARNIGIEQARGEWIMFLDADDLPHSDWISKAIETGVRTKADIVVFRADKVDATTGTRTPLPNLLKIAAWADGEAHKLDELKRERFMTLGTAPWNKLIRSKIIKQYGIRFQSLTRSNDIAFSVELLAKAETFAAIDESLLDYRVNHATSLQSGNLKTPFVFLKALNEARRRLHGKCRAAYWSYWFDIAAYQIRSWILLLLRRGF